MFSGIVEETGIVRSLQLGEKSCQLTVEANRVLGGIKLGDSIANNGCCLTVSSVSGKMITFDLLQETLRATNLGDLSAGHRINLERSLQVNDRIGGHFVTGHVDTTGVITVWEKKGQDYTLEIEVPFGMERYLVPKGCVAIDGISLTVGQVEENRFSLWIIPHTMEVTALQERQVGDRVNLEFDLLAKYTEKLIAQR
ncbi:MAG: riboflavin synthase [Blastochloris sp.]|nr:riboflavin synthase [Blastochloris sp.]